MWFKMATSSHSWNDMAVQWLVNDVSVMRIIHWNWLKENVTMEFWLSLSISSLACLQFPTFWRMARCVLRVPTQMTAWQGPAMPLCPVREWRTGVLLAIVSSQYNDQTVMWLVSAVETADDKTPTNNLVWLAIITLLHVTTRMQLINPVNCLSWIWFTSERLTTQF